MIENDTQLKVTQEQIQRLEYALAALRRTATPAEFAAQASAIIEHIRRMREEIDTYVGVYEAEPTSLRP
jgi:Asp-tRNA(Asn)/Glu-tRNA(Gln) amidotransferase C subunit